MKLLIIFFITFLGFHSVVFATSNLERLFMNNEQRAKLNKLRSEPMLTIEKELLEELPDPPRYIVFNGVLIPHRSTQEPTLWISDEKGFYQPNERYQTSFSVELDDTFNKYLLIQLYKTKSKKWLNPGEALDTVEGKIIPQEEIKRDGKS